MDVGVPAEVKNTELRVALTPAGAHELVRGGHRVLVQEGAGAGSSIPDQEFATAGATIVADVDEVWGSAGMVLKVKEPVAEEYGRLREDLVLFTYLHLAASRPCTDALLAAGTTAIAYETVQLADGSLPLLAPMSEVAGRMAPQVGAHHLQADGGGRGVLMGGVSGVYAAKVVVLGAGVSGMNAAAISLGMEAEVLVLDRDVNKLRSADRIYQGHLQTVTSNTYEIERACIDADLVIGAVLVPGARAPKLVTVDLVERMKPGSVLVDISIDQGGCFEGSRPTTHAEPTYQVGRSLY
ncbi:MAG: alanine dehydrogenase, partial [Candidatus Dormibacteria bacterium]